MKTYHCSDNECDYFFDEKIKKYREIYTVESFSDLPPSIQEQIKTDKEEAQLILTLPES